MTNYSVKQTWELTSLSDNVSEKKIVLKGINGAMIGNNIDMINNASYQTKNITIYSFLMALLVTSTVTQIIENQYCYKADFYLL